MNKSDLEESKRFFNYRYQTEKDRDIKNFIGQLESLVEEIKFESHMDFRRSFEERVHDFKKKNDKYPTIHFDQNVLKWLLWSLYSSILCLVDNCSNNFNQLRL